MSSQTPIGNPPPLFSFHEWRIPFFDSLKPDGIFPVRLQRVDFVDTLLDGDAGSRRLAILALLPLSPLAERSLRPTTPCS